MFELAPFSERNSMSNWFDNMEKQMFRGFMKDFSPIKTDIMDKGDHYEVEAELPGFNKEDITMTADGNYLTLKAERKSENEDKQKDYICRERSYGSFTRSFDLTDVQADKIQASYKDGVLAINMPKKTPDDMLAKKIDIL